MIFVYSPIAQYNNIGFVFKCLVNLSEKILQDPLHWGMFIVKNRNIADFKPVFFNIADFKHIQVRKNRVIDF